MTKRASTTAKVTKATALLVDGYTAYQRTGSGVIVRHHGEEHGVIAVRHTTDLSGKPACYFVCQEKVTLVVSPTDLREVNKLIPASECTIRKTTIQALKKWNDRYASVYDLIEKDVNGTVGSPSHRFIVSRRGGIATDHLWAFTPVRVARFIDDTLQAETVGLWEAGGTYYLDANTSFDRLPTALEWGRSQDQIAVWDTVTEREVLC